ncbi:DNA methyltransferase [Candidatus Poriferisocius sp.]|uniref:DNA methyltransferase n=1 Tax=Candidatus Poriferisocius sp. TaxID=3101276 RepID=UPI003B5C9F2C
MNALLSQDAPAHDWYRFVLSFPPHLVRDYTHRFGLDGKQRLLDPFCGTGTTLVEAKKLGIPSVGLEAVGVSRLAASTKVDWSPDPDSLAAHAGLIAEKALAILAADGISDEPMQDPPSEVPLRSLPAQTAKLLLKNSISPLPLHKVLVLKEALEGEHDARFAAHEKLALARVLPTDVGNLRFGPEVGVGRVKQDASVVSRWMACVLSMADDIRHLGPSDSTPACAIEGDAREVGRYIEPKSVDAVITSPPYPNEKDYSRTVRLESVLLGYISERSDLQAMKKELVRSNTRGVYRNDNDDEWVSGDAEVERIAASIEARRIELGKESGFERMYHRVTKLYFGGMARHFASLGKVLRPGARLAYVVGDQASYLRVMIRTGQLLAEIAERSGYEVEAIDLFRTRHATATNEQLREEVLVLRWPGTAKA